MRKANVIVGFLNIIPFKWLSNIYGPILLSAKIGMQIYYYISLLIFHLVITFPVVVGYVPCCGWLFIRIGKRMEIKATYYYYVGTPTPLNWSQRLLLYYKIITILLMLSTTGWQESIILRYKFNDLCCLQPRPPIIFKWLAAATVAFFSIIEGVPLLLLPCMPL